MDQFVVELISQIRGSSKVFICGHKNADADAIVSSIAISELCSLLDRESYIVLDDPRLEMVTERIYDKAKDKYKFIRRSEYEKLVDSQSSLILCDANKDYLIPIEPFSNVSIIDHHGEDEATVDSTNKYIDTKVSSASEIIYNIFNMLNIEISSDLANYLLAGIYLDTNHFNRNYSDSTRNCVESLVSKGAEIKDIEDLFKEDEETLLRINDLVFNGTVIKEYIDNGITVSFVLNREKPNTIYLGEDLAKAADINLENGSDVAFALGYVDDGTVKISARGRDGLHVGNIMRQVLGGGNGHSGATQFKDGDLMSVEEELMSIVDENLSEKSRTK